MLTAKFRERQSCSILSRYSCYLAFVVMADSVDDLALLKLDGSEHSDGSDKEDQSLWMPLPPREDCPVCFVPLPLENELCEYRSCCGKFICTTCVWEGVRAHRLINLRRARKELPELEDTCIFCRTPRPKSGETDTKLIEERMKRGDPTAMFRLACFYLDGDICNGIQKNEEKASKLFHQASDLGSVQALSLLGTLYFDGTFPTDDPEKGAHFAAEAAKKGDVVSRFNLYVNELRKGNTDLAIRHLSLAARAGHEKAMKEMWKYFYKGVISKDRLEKTLREYQNSCKEMKSDDRERFMKWKEAEEGDDIVLQNLYLFYYAGKIKAKELSDALKNYRVKA